MEKFRISVDYGRKVEDGVDASRLDWASTSVTSKNFPTSQVGVVEVEVELAPFFRRILTREVLNEIGLISYSPIDIHQLLALGEQHPDVQLKFPIVALGSSWEYRSNIYIPYLASYGSRRDLRLSEIKQKWCETCRFAVVRRVVSF